LWESSDPAEEEEVDQHTRYFNLIIARHESLRAQLQQTPPPEVLEALGKDYPTHIGRLTAAVAKWWRWKMRTVDPRPAQVASMDKSTVLRLLGLLTGGTLLKRGAEVEVGVSRWAWSLLARLPERGELTSEEIGVVRELGKKAVLIGVGLHENQNWEEGMQEVEKDFNVEEHEELLGIVHEDETELDCQDNGVNWEGTENDAETSSANLLRIGSFIGPRLPDEEPSLRENDANGGDIPMAVSVHEGGEEGQNATSEEEGELSSEEAPENNDTLAAARARILARLDQQQNGDSDSDDLLEPEVQAARDTKAAALWNTKATVDMIITVAGELYGQRDLLEFRGAWEE
jgi:Survival motor neuron (SMN) interacting protein 1 (SIP1)